MQLADTERVYERWSKAIHHWLNTEKIGIEPRSPDRNGIRVVRKTSDRERVRGMKRHAGRVLKAFTCHWPCGDERTGSAARDRDTCPRAPCPMAESDDLDVDDEPGDAILWYQYLITSHGYGDHRYVVGRETIIWTTAVQSFPLPPNRFNRTVRRAALNVLLNEVERSGTFETAGNSKKRTRHPVLRLSGSYSRARRSPLVSVR